MNAEQQERLLDIFANDCQLSGQNFVPPSGNYTKGSEAALKEAVEGGTCAIGALLVDAYLHGVLSKDDFRIVTMYNRSSAVFGLPARVREKLCVEYELKDYQMQILQMANDNVGDDLIILSAEGYEKYREDIDPKNAQDIRESIVISQLLAFNVEVLA